MLFSGAVVTLSKYLFYVHWLLLDKPINDKSDNLFVVPGFENQVFLFGFECTHRSLEKRE